MATRWGIIGVGMVSHDFVGALKVLPKEEHKVVAVAARSLQDAKDFAAKYGIEKAYGSYSDVAKDSNVDVAYIATIHTFHLPIATEMLKAGKAVLCEKPLCMNVRETRQLTHTARECGAFLMEGLWTRFFPAYKELSRRLKDGEIGEVVHVIASRGHSVTHVARFRGPELGGGATLRLGIYPILVASLAMGGERPLKVMAGGHLNDKGVDETATACLVYSKGRVATVSISICANLPCEAHIVGTKGTIKVPYPIWSPEELEGPWGRSSYPLPKTPHTFHFQNSEGLIYQAMEVRRCLKEGLLESPGMPHAESITLAEIMEQVRTQVGTVYPQDSL